MREQTERTANIFTDGVDLSWASGSIFRGFQVLHFVLEVQGSAEE